MGLGVLPIVPFVLMGSLLLDVGCGVNGPSEGL
jgi:hypothetical protein